ncbi:hypothetical protein AVEN_199020-1 [Araneus ventricosus]|uniref:Uncharacterized protein n=1 Tax=Araneus ventricosus TaxID=182803 RepID=A0A4Y2UR65_ARAVE|nr:hypothetical protein AVEN_199020-1 [Araneus ventricosus]
MREIPLPSSKTTLTAGTVRIPRKPSFSPNTSGRATLAKKVCSAELDNGESASTDAEDVLNEGNTISHSAALQPAETLLDYMGQRGFDYGDIPAVRKICVDIRQEMNKEQKQRDITDFLKQIMLKGKFLV